MKTVLAVDVGGTNIKTAVFDEQLNVLDSQSLDTPQQDSTGQSVVRAISQLFAELSKSYEIAGIGLAVPGTLDEAAGITHWAGNLNWHDLPIVSLLHKEVGVPVAFKHDVRAGALAELRRGALQGCNDGIFLPVGTGIACAIVMDGEIRSASGYAGEIGHVNVHSDRSCVCGQTGCLEATSSTLAISKAYEKRAGKKLSTLEIVKNQSNDEIARAVFTEAIDGLVEACDVLVTLLAPEVIVIGGGLASAGDTLLAPLQTKLNSRLTFQRKPKITTAKFGIQAGMYGCGIMAWEKLNG